MKNSTLAYLPIFSDFLPFELLPIICSRRKGYSARVLFIHGLSRQATEAALKDRFAQYGTVTALHIPFNAVSRTPKIYGFVRMSTPEEATAALEGETGKTFMGQMIEVERAKRGEDAEDRGRGRNFNRSYSGARDGRPQRGGYYGGRPINGGGYRREYSPQPPPARYSVRDDYPPSRPFVAGPPPHVDRYPVAHPPRRDYDRYEPAEVRRRDPYDVPPAPYRPRDPYGGYDYPPHGPAPPARHYPRDYPPAPVGPPAGRYNAPPPSSAPYYDSPQHAQHYNDYPPAHTGAYRSGPPPPGERPMPPRRRYDDRPEEDPAYPARFERRLGNNGAPNARPYPPPPPHGPSRGRSPPPPNARY